MGEGGYPEPLVVVGGPIRQADGGGIHCRPDPKDSG